MSTTDKTPDHASDDCTKDPCGLCQARENVAIIKVRLEVQGKSGAALDIVDRVLDNGDFQDAINEYDSADEMVTVLSATVSEEAEDPEPPIECPNCNAGALLEKTSAGVPAVVKACTVCKRFESDADAAGWVLDLMEAAPTKPARPAGCDDDDDWLSTEETAAAFAEMNAIDIGQPQATVTLSHNTMDPETCECAECQARREEKE